MFIFSLSRTGRIDPDAAFKLCVRFGEYIARLDDGTVVTVPRKDEDWYVDYRSFSIEKLHDDISQRIRWGSCQEIEVYGTERYSGDEIKYCSSMDLLLSFSERWSARYMFLHVLVVDKAGYQGSTSSVTQMSDIVAAKVIAEGASCSQHGSTVNVCESVVVMPAVDPSVEGPPVQVEDTPNIDWSKLDIVNVPDGPGMEEDQMYVLLGLRARMRE